MKLETIRFSYQKYRKMTIDRAALRREDIVITPEMIKAAANAIRDRYLDLADPENLPSLCRDALLSGISASLLNGRKGVF